MARVTRRDVVPWQVRAPETKDGKEPEKTTPIVTDAARVGALFLSSFEVGVEVSQAHDDAAPIAIAYMDIDPSALPPPPAATPAPQVVPAKVSGGASAPTRLGFVDVLGERR